MMAVMRVFLIGVWLVFGLGALGAEVSMKDRALGVRSELREKVMPYWLKTVDWERGGYLLADDGDGRGEARDKQLVSQARMVWGFSVAHQKGLGGVGRDYLAAARSGVEFLESAFLDREHGGYYWKVDLEGKPVNSCKFLYGEAFVVYALVEYHRASGEEAALGTAMKLYEDIQRHMYDREHGGWIEHTEADWVPLKRGDSRNEVEVVGYKSANAHLHWMEALSELFLETRDAGVGKSLSEALEINCDYFYPEDAGKSCFHRQADWSVVTEPSSAGLSYGHNVEFAWLMVRAMQALGREPLWGTFSSHLDHALKHGVDGERGGLYSRGVGDEAANDTVKVWWAQAEWMAALVDGMWYRPDPRYQPALEAVMRFTWEHMVDPRDGMWYDTVAADGKVLRKAKAHNWKAAYHDVRAMVKLIDLYGEWGGGVTGK